MPNYLTILEQRSVWGKTRHRRSGHKKEGLCPSVTGAAYQSLATAFLGVGGGRWEIAIRPARIYAPCTPELWRGGSSAIPTI